jgi:hypothetical protein
METAMPRKDPHRTPQSHIYWEGHGGPGTVVHIMTEKFSRGFFSQAKQEIEQFKEYVKPYEKYICSETVSVDGFGSLLFDPSKSFWDHVHDSNSVIHQEVQRAPDTKPLYLQGLLGPFPTTPRA